MNNAIIYARYSPRPGRTGDAEKVSAQEDAESIRLQIEVCERYATMKSLNVIRIIRDPETSARKTRLFDRDGGYELRNLESGTHVICSKLDRVFRSTADGLMTMEHFRRRGIILHFADQSGCTLDLSTGEGEFMFTMLLGAAALEPRRTADRTSKAMRYRQANGERMTAPNKLPFGRMLDPNDPNRTIPCEEELKAIEQAKGLSEFGFSLRQIAEQLGPIRGKVLSPQSVKRMIGER